MQAEVSGNDCPGFTPGLRPFATLERDARKRITVLREIRAITNSVEHDPRYKDGGHVLAAKKDGRLGTG
jgi:hypothetical protein